ncbi:hypothetical protein B0T16DRAFT_456198 [Cercophora newfieldiana]|uniref:Uncharacterized protein n=1 Tax=Cercophora newfieldiana TaxID=92897 RepID=A0AA39YA29_9PEZI|nr:hypothetical protein B0T16DRAFT_456198 [Cercophora newfieldiana]
MFYSTPGSHVDASSVQSGTELRHTPDIPKGFIRTLSARAIMSNEISTLNSSAEFLYCMGDPDVTSEETHREFGRCCPWIRYHMGRACAVAGYATLYKELSLLPDISTAEKARDNTQNPGSRETSNRIVS